MRPLPPAARLLAQPLLRQVGADDLDPSRPERGRGRREPEWLTPEVVGGDEQDHTGIVARPRRTLDAVPTVICFTP